MSTQTLSESSAPGHPDLRLVPMRWWHLDEVVRLEQTTFGAGQGAWGHSQFYAELAAPGRWLQVLTDGSQVWGYVDVAVVGRDADLMTIVVAPQLRGQGWGLRLLDAGRRAAAEHGADVMFLEVRADNPARRLYERAGFVRIDTRRDYYGPGEDACVMRGRTS